MQQWVMKQGRLIVHTRSYNVTMGNEARKTHCSHKELQCVTTRKVPNFSTDLSF
ncbi:hypothetical protein KSS87_006655 [Heliosperma pusillum]|nr:hypothetical protein KSS87_006655 [Heliosperma pusillum]